MADWLQGGENSQANNENHSTLHGFKVCSIINCQIDNVVIAGPAECGFHHQQTPTFITLQPMVIIEEFVADFNHDQFGKIFLGASCTL